VAQSERIDGSRRAYYSVRQWPYFWRIK